MFEIESWPGKFSMTAAAATLLSVLVISLPAQVAASGPVMQREVERLFDYLEDSGCRFYRNGGWHDAGEARTHLERKYGYLLRKGLIRTSEDFIDRGASRSSISGEPYEVQCGDGRPVPSSQWLGQALTRLRKAPAPRSARRGRTTDHPGAEGGR